MTEPSARAQSGLQVSFIDYSNVPRNSIRISSGIKIDIFKGLRNKRAGLRVISGVQRLKIDIVGVVNVILDGNIGRKIEIGICIDS